MAYIEDLYDWVSEASRLSVQRNMPHLLLRSDALALIIDFIRVIGKAHPL